MFVPPEIPYISVFGFPVYYYGIILALAILAGVLTANWVSIKEYFICNVIPEIATSVIIGGIVGARLYYCLLNSAIYIKNPLEIFMIREGGLSIHGAILGGAIILIYQAKKHNIEFLKLCDICTMGLPIAQAIGRWGNFFNSEAFGLPTDLPWKMFISQPYRPDKFFSYEYFHPTFLYESILNLIIFVILYKFILKKYKENYGIITASYLILYSLVRIFTEYLRVDCVKYIWGIPFPVIISALLITLSAGFIIFKTRKPRG